MQSRLRGLLILATAPLLAGDISSRTRRSTSDDAYPNSHRQIAGVLRDGDYSLTLELRRATWHPNAPSALALEVPAFAEAGHAASVPGPLIRVSAGTRMHITVRNALSQRATVHGLHDHAGGRDSVMLAPGEEREVRFVAERVGTFAYFARTNARPTLLSRGDDSQLAAAFIVDSARVDSRAANARERLVVITAWDDSLPTPASRYGLRQVFALNGQSWPFTERLNYTQGDSVRWRVLNMSHHAHPMHLHGTYFRVESRGTPFTDSTLRDPSRLAVTEHLLPGETMVMAWKADRPGNWLFHCHTINHIDEALRLGDAATGSAHADHGRVTDVMAGLVTAISVRPKAGARPRSATPQRRLRVVVTERATQGGGAPSFAYVLQRDAREPARDSLELPGSTLELVQGEPTAITVVNRGTQPTSVHWHGMELQSFYDGVPGWSGSGTRVAPIIAPGDSFVAHMTPPRAGTFIYHTHAGELEQLRGGLYGALIVRPRGRPRDSTDRLVVLGDSTGGPEAKSTPPSLVNGRRDPAPIELAAGTTHRLRFISIGSTTLRTVRLLDGNAVLRWTPVAKDGAEFSMERRREVPAERMLGAGETLDVFVTPSQPGEVVLEVASQLAVVTRVRVRVRAAQP